VRLDPSCDIVTWHRHRTMPDHQQGSQHPGFRQPALRGVRTALTVHIRSARGTALLWRVNEVHRHLTNVGVPSAIPGLALPNGCIGCVHRR
jgi:hypothetical protein